jgi:hypothetical protein
MGTLEIILIIAVVLLVFGGGYGYSRGVFTPAQPIGWLINIIVLVLVIVLLFRLLKIAI